WRRLREAGSGRIGLPLLVAVAMVPGPNVLHPEHQAFAAFAHVERELELGVVLCLIPQRLIVERERQVHVLAPGQRARRLELCGLDYEIRRREARARDAHAAGRAGSELERDAETLLAGLGDPGVHDHAVELARAEPGELPDRIVANQPRR